MAQASLGQREAGDPANAGAPLRLFRFLVLQEAIGWRGGWSVPERPSR